MGRYAKPPRARPPAPNGNMDAETREWVTFLRDSQEDAREERREIMARIDQLAAAQSRLSMQVEQMLTHMAQRKRVETQLVMWGLGILVTIIGSLIAVIYTLLEKLASMPPPPL